MSIRQRSDQLPSSGSGRNGVQASSPAEVLPPPITACSSYPGWDLTEIRRVSAAEFDEATITSHRNKMGGIPSALQLKSTNSNVRFHVDLPILGPATHTTGSAATTVAVKELSYHALYHKQMLLFGLSGELPEYSDSSSGSNTTTTLMTMMMAHQQAGGKSAPAAASTGGMMVGRRTEAEWAQRLTTNVSILDNDEQAENYDDDNDDDDDDGHNSDNVNRASSSFPRGSVRCCDPHEVDFDDGAPRENFVHRASSVLCGGVNILGHRPQQQQQEKAQALLDPSNVGSPSCIGVFDNLQRQQIHERAVPSAPGNNTVALVATQQQQLPLHHLRPLAVDSSDVLISELSSASVEIELSPETHPRGAAHPDNWHRQQVPPSKPATSMPLHPPHGAHSQLGIVSQLTSHDLESANFHQQQQQQQRVTAGFGVSAASSGFFPESNRNTSASSNAAFVPVGNVKLAATGGSNGLLLPSSSFSVYADHNTKDNNISNNQHQPHQHDPATPREIGGSGGLSATQEQQQRAQQRAGDHHPQKTKNDFVEVGIQRSTTLVRDSSAAQQVRVTKELFARPTGAGVFAAPKYQRLITTASSSSSNGDGVTVNSTAMAVIDLDEPATAAIVERNYAGLPHAALLDTSLMHTPSPALVPGQEVRLSDYDNSNNSSNNISNVFSNLTIHKAVPQIGRHPDSDLFLATDKTSSGAIVVHRLRTTGAATGNNIMNNNRNESIRAHVGLGACGSGPFLGVLGFAFSDAVITIIQTACSFLTPLSIVVREMLTPSMPRMQHPQQHTDDSDQQQQYLQQQQQQQLVAQQLQRQQVAGGLASVVVNVLRRLAENRISHGDLCLDSILIGAGESGPATVVPVRWSSMVDYRMFKSTAATERGGMKVLLKQPQHQQEKEIGIETDAVDILRECLRALTTGDHGDAMSSTLPQPQQDAIGELVGDLVKRQKTTPVNLAIALGNVARKLPARPDHMVSLVKSFFATSSSNAINNAAKANMMMPTTNAQHAPAADHSSGATACNMIANGLPPAGRSRKPLAPL